jgi:hypothetical protein
MFELGVTKAQVALASQGRGGGVDSPPAIVPNAGLHFDLLSVHCVEETHPKAGGKDTIGCGGVAVSDKEVTTTINEFVVGKKFEDGVTVNYGANNALQSFSLDAVYPKTFVVLLALAEKDSGGFSTFLSELYDAIKTEVQIILTASGAALGAAAGAGIGGTVGTAIGGPLGTVVGIAAGLILGAIVGWLADVAKDDMFEPKAASIDLPAADSVFAGGGMTSPTLSLAYNDHGGRYEVRYQWRLVK